MNDENRLQLLPLRLSFGPLAILPRLLGYSASAFYQSDLSSLELEFP